MPHYLSDRPAMVLRSPGIPTRWLTQALLAACLALPASLALACPFHQAPGLFPAADATQPARQPDADERDAPQDPQDLQDPDAPGLVNQLRDLMRKAVTPDGPNTQPKTPEVAPQVTRLLNDRLLNDTQKRRLRIFHGQWPGRSAQTLDDPNDAALFALLKRDLHDPSLVNPEADPLLRRRAAWLRGETQVVLDTLEGLTDFEPRYLRAQAQMDRGDRSAAAEELRGLREAFYNGDPELSAAELTAAAEGIVLLARLEGRGGLDDFRLALRLLEKARDRVDPLYWPAMVAEARILLGKSNVEQAEQAARQALALNPTAADALHILGTIAVGSFNFSAVDETVSYLRSVNAQHLTADQIEAASLIRQKDPDAARTTLAPALDRYPKQRELLLLAAQTEALAYDDQALEQAANRFRVLSPDSAELPAALGDFYADARQYDLARKFLADAIALEPGWSDLHVLLGKTLMQQGDLPAASLALRRAQGLDPSHVDVVNYLKLVDKMLRWETLETDHFIIRYRTHDDQGKPVSDAVWARDVQRLVDPLAKELIERFQYTPTVKTQLDLLPDDYHFSVRIAGLPEIWTVGACTGDVIAMTAPRVGVHRQFETYDWLLVLRHEYVHTLTLGKTNNRIPHWFTEALAVDQETTGRTWDRHQLLSKALREGWLFGLDDISWGFIRPKRPFDRSLAYAQGGWIVEYIEERFGYDTLLDMMDLQAEGATNARSLYETTGLTIEQFDADFLAWATEQVEAWGMDLPEAEAAVLKRITTDDGDLKDGSSNLPALDALISEEGLQGQPDLLKFRAQVIMEAKPLDIEAAFAAVEAYRKARPVDPWADRMAVKLSAKRGDLPDALEPLKRLDAGENSVSEYADTLSILHRQAGRLDAAQAALGRALLREPFNADFRERSVRVALMRRDLQEAAFQLESLTLLEPGQDQHFTRLAYVLARLGQPQAASQAAQQAKALNSEAPVDHLLNPTPDPQPEPQPNPQPAADAKDAATRSAA